MERRSRRRRERRRRRQVVALSGVATLCALALALAGVGAVFTSTTTGPASVLGAAQLDPFVPATVTASRLNGATCRVTWTASAAPGAPAGLTYDVTDGTSTLATAVNALTVDLATSADVTARVHARAGTWTSAAWTTSAAACGSAPDAPTGVGTATGDGQVTATWTAPNARGAAITGYTMTATPPSGPSSTCTATDGTGGCTVSGLTNGLTYTVTVRATNAWGTGPSSAGVTAVPYPAAVMTAARMRLWLDGADATTLFTDTAGTTRATGSGQAVARWNDKSGQGNHVTQDTPGDRPSLTTAAGRLVPGFNGTSTRLTGDATKVPTGTTTSTAFVAATLTAATTSTRSLLLWGVPTSNNARSILARNADVCADTYQVATFPCQTGTAVTGRPLLAVSEVTSTTHSLSVDARAWTTTSASPATGSTVLRIGRGDATFWHGPIPEVLVFTGALTDAERRRVAEYLARKWATAITPSAPTGVQVTSTGTTAAVSWTPGWDGGASATGYSVTATPDGGGPAATCTATAPATGCTLTGLSSDGARHTVTVTATNTVGIGPASTAHTFFAGAPSQGDLRLWLDAADLDGDGRATTADGAGEGGVVTGRAQTWVDKSSTGAHTTAPSTGERPQYAVRALNGLPVLTFDGTTVLKGAGAGTNPYGVQGDRTLVVLTRPHAISPGIGGNGTMVVDRSSETPGLFGLKVGSAGTWLLQSRDDGYALLVDDGGTVAPSAGRADVLLARRSGTANDLVVSGRPGGAWTLPGTLTQHPVSLGRHETWHSASDLDIAEVLLYGRALTPAEARGVERYLALKWGTALAPMNPTAVAATPGAGQASVTWTAPADTGSGPVTGYTATATPGGATCTTAGTGCTITGLANGTTYTVSVTAANTTGAGRASAAVAVTPRTVPGAPSTPGLTPGDGQVLVTWTAPADGGAAITGYTATTTPVGGGSSASCTTAGTSCTVAGLSNGTTYSVSVTATNAAGTGAASGAVPAVPYPASVMSASATRVWLDARTTSTLFQNTAGTTPTTSGTAVARWNDRSGTGSNAVLPSGPTAPVLAAGAINGHAAVRFDRTQPTYLEITNPGIGAVGSADRTLFAVAVGRTTENISTNHGGGIALWLGMHSGLWLSSYGTGTTVSSTVASTWSSNGTIQAELPATGALVLSQVAASSGSVLTNVTGANGAVATATGSGTWRTYGDLLRIGAANSWGTDNYNWYLDGDIGEVVVLNRAVTSTERREVEEYLARKWSLTITPQAPATAAATPGDASLAVSWTAPAWNGGANVTGYTATASPGGATCTSTGTTCTITGLTNGETYTVSVAATNSAGAGPGRVTTSAVPYPATVMTPARLRLWLDGADPTTLFQNTAATTPATTPGHPVARWNDKSGQANHASQAGSSNRPTLASSGGRLVPAFNGTSAFLSADPTKLPAGSTPSTSFIAATPGDTSTFRAALIWGDMSLDAARSHVAPNDSFCVDGFESAPYPCRTASLQAGRPMIGTGAFAADAMAVAVDGSPWTTTAAGLATGTTVARIGRGNNAYWSGPIAETIVFTGTLTAAERRVVEEYLARKWATPITPAAPTGVSATPGDAQVTASWSAPAWNGGATVTGYTATATPTGGGATASCTTSGTTCTIPGLTNGTPHTITVTAANSVGTGPAGAATTATPANYSAQVLATSGLAGYWKLADPTGSPTAADSSGQGRTGTVGAGVTLGDPARPMPADTSTTAAFASFNQGITIGDVGGIGGAYDFAGTSPFSLAAWVRSGQLSGSHLYPDMIYKKRYVSQSDQNGWHLHLDGTVASSWSPGGIGIGRWSAGTWNGTVAQLPLSTWTHVAATYDGTHLRLYLNNRLVGTTASTLAIPDTTEPLVLGRGWEDRLAHVAIWNRALTGAEITALYTQAGSPVAPTAPHNPHTATATPSAASLGASWAQPLYDGLSPITSYTATASPGGATCTTATTSCTITGLTAGTPYTVTVTATNAVGTGPPSPASAAATPS